VDSTHSFAFELEPRIFPSYGNLHIHEVAHRDTASRSFFAWTRLRIELGNRIFVMPSCMRQLRIMSSIVRFFHCLIPTLHCRNPLFLYSSSLLTLRTYARLRPLDSDQLDPIGLIYFCLTFYSWRTRFELGTRRLGLCASFPRVYPYLHTFENDWPTIRNTNFLKLSEVHTSVNMEVPTVERIPWVRV
jgi:hypothetical protein